MAVWTEIRVLSVATVESFDIYCNCYLVGGKTLCKILTVADTMPLPMADPRVDGNSSRHGYVRPPLQRGGQPHLEPAAAARLPCRANM